MQNTDRQYRILRPHFSFLDLFTNFLNLSIIYSFLGAQYANALYQINMLFVTERDGATIVYKLVYRMYQSSQCLNKKALDN